MCLRTLNRKVNFPDDVAWAERGILNTMNLRNIIALFVIASVTGAPSFARADPPAHSANSTLEESSSGPNNIPVLTTAPAPSVLQESNKRQEESFTSPVDFFFGRPTRGKVLFQQKCARCHTIGHGVKVGPDLKNITAKGPREYLFNFIMNPDKYIKENHPIAVELLKHYGIKMPDLGLSRQQTLDIFAYLKAAEDEN